LSGEPRPPARRAQAADLVGRTVAGRYRIIEVVAVGGIGAVYRAEHVHMRRTVALKVLRPDVDGFPELVSRFEREAVAGGSLRHPHLASAIDFGQLDDGSYYLVVEFVPGITLRELIRRGPVRPARALRIARQIAEGIGACHRLGIVHRDLKPRNIMVDPDSDDLVKVIDFGLARVPMERLAAKAADDEDEAPTRKNLTLHGIVFGTVAYMAPETAFGMDAVDERSDLYALGVVLYEMLAGRHPFDPDDPTELFLCHRITDPPPIFDRAPGALVPPALEGVVRRLMEKQPNQRFQTADELCTALDEAAASAGLSPHPSMSDSRGALPSRPPPRGMLPTPLSTPGAFVLPMAAPPEVGVVHLDFDRQTGDALPLARGSAPSGRTVRPPPLWLGRWPRPTIRQVVLGVAALCVVGGGLSLFLTGGDHAAVQPAPPVPAEALASSVALTPTAVASVDAPVERARLLSAFREQKWRAGAGSLLRLLELDPGALKDGDVRRAALKVSLRAAFSEWEGVDALFDGLAERAEHEGLDVLYEMVATQGGSRGARLAAARLARPDVRARANDALAIALDLRQAACADKEALFERAAKHGDHRARLYLEQFVSRHCNARHGMCCFHGHDGLARTILGLPEP